jgi:hypothetical protein
LWARLWDWAEMMDLHRCTQFFGNIWLLIGNLFSICVFMVSQKETNIWPSVRATKKIMNTQIKNGHFVMCICVSGQRNHLFCKTNTQKMVAKVNNLCTEEKPSFVYSLIRVSGKEITA